VASPKLKSARRPPTREEIAGEGPGWFASTARLSCRDAAGFVGVVNAERRVHDGKNDLQFRAKRVGAVTKFVPRIDLQLTGKRWNLLARRCIHPLMMDGASHTIRCSIPQTPLHTLLELPLYQR